MKLTRSRVIALLTSALVLPRCSGKTPERPIRIGSKDFIENITVAEIYATALECADYPVERRMILGDANAAADALITADGVDLYPEYTATGLFDVLKGKLPHDGGGILPLLQLGYKVSYRSTWLAPAQRVDNAHVLIVTPKFAECLNLRTLSECARLAPKLRFATVGDFRSREDGLPALQRHYNGFKFRTIRKFAIGAQFDAMLSGKADVAVAFTTDPQITPKDFVVLGGGGFLPPYQIAPVVRSDILRSHQRIATVLNSISPLLTNAILHDMNVQVALNQRDPAQVAEEFLYGHLPKLSLGVPKPTCVLSSPAPYKS